MDQKLLDFVDQQVESHIPRSHWQDRLIGQGYKLEDIDQALHEVIKRKHSDFEKKMVQKVADFALPIGVFLVFFIFYNHFKLTTSELIKNSGLTAITVLAVTLIIGPISKFIKPANLLKIHRKFWGVSGFAIAVVHGLLAFYKDYTLSLTALFSVSDPHFSGILSGLAAIVLLLLITASSNKKSIDFIGAKNWKRIQTASYLALIFAILHFYLMETNNGIFIIRRLLGRFAFGFVILVILLRLFVFILSLFSKKPSEVQTTVPSPPQNPS